MVEFERAGHANSWGEDLREIQSTSATYFGHGRIGAATNVLG